jgi:hypothetical protein
MRYLGTQASCLRLPAQHPSGRTPRRQDACVPRNYEIDKGSYALRDRIVGEQRSLGEKDLIEELMK